MPYITVMPAYGRDYKNQRTALADWKGGKDFIETSSRRACSIRDIDANTRVIIRYDRLLKTMEVK